MTRRRALGLGALAGLGALLARPLPALGRGTSAPVSFGLDVRPADFPDGGRVSRVLRTSRRFDLVGLRAARSDVDIRVRRADGSWSRWAGLGARGDHAPDSGGAHASDPVWTGGSRELQLRLGKRPTGRLRLQFVAVPASARKRVRPQLVARAAQVGEGEIPAPPPIIPRSAWGAEKVPPREPPSYGVVQLAFVHHTVSLNSYGPEDSAGMVLGIAEYHRNRQGWNDIGYNFLVDQYGQIFEGRAGGIDQAVIGAQAQGWNSVSTSVAVIGTFDNTGMSPAALTAVSKILGWKLSRHGVPVTGTVDLMSVGGGGANRWPKGKVVSFHHISGHRDGCTTECPGNAAYRQLGAIRSRAQKYAFTLPTGTVAQVSLVAASLSVKYNQQARLSGTVLRGDATPAAGETVVVQRRSGGGWTTIGQTTAGGDGTWTLSLPWRATGTIRAQAGGVSSPDTRIACRPKVTRGKVARRVSAGGSVRVGGTVQPAVAVYVLVEKRSRGKWRRSSVVRAKVRGGKYDVSVRFAKPGAYRLTVKAGSPDANARARRARVDVVRARRARRAMTKTTRKPTTAPKPAPAAPSSSGGVSAR